MTSMKLQNYLLKGNSAIVCNNKSNHEIAHEIIKFHHVYASIAQTKALDEALQHEIPSDAFNDKQHPYWNSDDATWLIKETLCDAMNEIAPDGYYFSESSDNPFMYGFWSYGDEYVQ